jgi:hypothetical protein
VVKLYSYFLKLIWLIGLTSMGATAFIHAAQLVGSEGSDNPVIQGFLTDCVDQPQPCWYGITPGYTPISHAQRVLQTIRDRFDEMNVVERGQETWTLVSGSSEQRCSVNLLFGGTVVDSVSIRDCEALRIGDLMQVLGAPTTLRPYNLTFTDQSVVARLTFHPERDECFDLSPQTQVLALYLHIPLPPNIRLQTIPWTGFKSYSWYTHREGAVDCNRLTQMPFI